MYRVLHDQTVARCGEWARMVRSPTTSITTATSSSSRRGASAASAARAASESASNSQGRSIPTKVTRLNSSVSSLTTNS